MRQNNPQNSKLQHSLERNSTDDFLPLKCCYARLVSRLTHLEEPLHPAARVLGTLPVVAVRQQDRQPALAQPLVLSRRDELVEHHLQQQPQQPQQDISGPDESTGYYRNTEHAAAGHKEQNRQNHGKVRRSYRQRQPWGLCSFRPDDWLNNIIPYPQTFGQTVVPAPLKSMLTPTPTHPRTHLRSVREVAKLRLPEAERVGVLERVAHLEAKDAELGEDRVPHRELGLSP